MERHTAEQLCRKKKKLPTINIYLFHAIKIYQKLCVSVIICTAFFFSKHGSLIKSMSKLFGVSIQFFFLHMNEKCCNAYKCVTHHNPFD